MEFIFVAESDENHFASLSVGFFVWQSQVKLSFVREFIFSLRHLWFHLTKSVAFQHFKILNTTCVPEWGLFGYQNEESTK